MWSLEHWIQEKGIKRCCIVFQISKELLFHNLAFKIFSGKKWRKNKKSVMNRHRLFWNCWDNFPKRVLCIFVLTSAWWFFMMHKVSCSYFSTGVLCLLLGRWWWWQGQVDRFFPWYNTSWESCFDSCSVFIPSFRKGSLFSLSRFNFDVSFMLCEGYKFTFSLVVGGVTAVLTLPQN